VAAAGGTRCSCAYQTCAPDQAQSVHRSHVRDDWRIENLPEIERMSVSRPG